MPQARRRSEPVALVLAGGGARGAYEIGVLSVLLPALEEDERPDIIIGTSVGAINIAYLAANADQPPGQLAQGGLEQLTARAGALAQRQWPRPPHERRKQCNAR